MGKARYSYIIVGFTLFRIVYEFIPFVTFYSPHGLNLISVVALYFILAMELGFDRMASTILKYIPMFLITILAILFSTIKDIGVSTGMQVYMLFQDVLWILLMMYYVKAGDDRLNKFLLYFALGCLIITSVTTYFGCLALPGFSRRMTGGDLSDSEKSLYNSMNIGGFGFIYTVALSFPLFIYLFKANKINMFILAFLVIPMLMGIYQAEYTTALLTSIMGFTALFFSNKSSRSVVKLFLVFGVLFVLNSSFLSDILLGLANIIGSETMAERLSGSSELLSGAGSSESADVNARYDLMLQSLDNFFSNPFFGSGNNGGGHSWLFDNMSMFGIWGLSACIIVYSSIYKHTILPFKGTSYYHYVLFVFMLQVILSIVNTEIFYDTFIILIPLIYYAYPEKIQVKHTVVMG